MPGNLTMERDITGDWGARYRRGKGGNKSGAWPPAAATAR